MRLGSYKDNIIGLQCTLRPKALSCLHKLQTYDVGQQFYSLVSNLPWPKVLYGLRNSTLLKYIYISKIHFSKKSKFLFQEIQLTLFTAPSTPTRTTVTFKIIHFVDTLSSVLTQRGFAIIDIYGQKNINTLYFNVTPGTKKSRLVYNLLPLHMAFTELEPKPIFEVLDKSLHHQTGR